MKKKLEIPNILGYCKNCFSQKRNGSAYCGNCTEERMEIFTDSLFNFPLLEECKDNFELTHKQVLHTVFTYGDTIYSLGDLSYGLVAHEITHVFQQTKIGKKEWWKKYFSDGEFRLSQEVKAYQRQYQVYKNRNEVEAVHHLHDMAEALSGSMYGLLVDYDTAVKLIKK